MKFTIAQGNNSPAMVTNLSIEQGRLNSENDGLDEIKFIMENRYEEIVIEDDISGSVNILDKESAEVEYVFDESQTSTIGEYKAEFVVKYSTGAIETFPTRNKITIEVVEAIE